MSAVLRRTAGWPGAVVLAAVLMVAAGGAQTSAGHTILARAGLFEEPASYTSLAFAHPQSLPGRLPARRTRVGVSFVIRNSGLSRRDYQWSVLVVQAGRTRRVAAGAASVAAGRGTAVTRTAELSCAPGQARIVVQLAHPAETIDDWTCLPAGSFTSP